MIKKIIILIFSLVILLPKVNAETFVEDLPLRKDIQITDFEERYRWYKDIKVREYFQNENGSGCEDISGDFSDWSTIKPESKESRVIEEKSESVDLSSKEYNRIVLNGFIIEYLELKQVELTNDAAQRIPYVSISCSNCEKTATGSMLLNKNSSVEIKLDKLYSDIIQIEIRFGKDNNILFWETTLYKDLYPVRYRGTRTVGALTRVCASTYCLYKLNYLLPWTEYNSYNNIYYRYKDIKYKCFEYEREYAEGYYKELDGYIKDDTKKYNFYKYNEVKEKICPKIISQKNTNIEKELISDETNDLIAVNYGSKNIKNNFSKIYILVVCMVLILISLIAICIKIRKNIINDEK